MALWGTAFQLPFVVWDTNSNVGKTGDGGNLTLRWVKDGVAAAPTNPVVEIDAVNLPGLYRVLITAAEAQAIFGALGGKSSTIGISVMPQTVAFELSAAQVNAEIVDALSADITAELASAPPAASSIVARIAWLFLLAKNQHITDGAQDRIRNDANTADIASAALTDDTVTFVRDKWS